MISKTRQGRLEIISIPLDLNNRGAAKNMAKIGPILEVVRFSRFAVIFCIFPFESVCERRREKIAVVFFNVSFQVPPHIFEKKHPSLDPSTGTINKTLPQATSASSITS